MNKLEIVVLHLIRDIHPSQHIRIIFRRDLAVLFFWSWCASSGHGSIQDSRQRIYIYDLRKHASSKSPLKGKIFPTTIQVDVHLSSDVLWSTHHIFMYTHIKEIRVPNLVQPVARVNKRVSLLLSEDKQLHCRSCLIPPPTTSHSFQTYHSFSYNRSCLNPDPPLEQRYHHNLLL